MKISYAITVCNEIEEVARLLQFLIGRKREQDEIVVLLDKTKSDERMEILLKGYTHTNQITLSIDNFANHFGDWKNKLTDLCTGDFIFQIDADEIPSETLIENLPEILESNPSAEVLLVPRVNTVEGLTKEHLRRWHWQLNENGWVNWPDYQWRIYKKSPYIRWHNYVHERLKGFTVQAFLPPTEELALYHPKTIERQEKQNSFYDSL